jgi:hypothetical protein
MRSRPRVVQLGQRFGRSIDWRRLLRQDLAALGFRPSPVTPNVYCIIIMIVTNDPPNERRRVQPWHGFRVK